MRYQVVIHFAGVAATGTAQVLGASGSRWRWALASLAALPGAPGALVVGRAGRWEVAELLLGARLQHRSGRNLALAAWAAAGQWRRSVSLWQGADQVGRNTVLSSAERSQEWGVGVDQGFMNKTDGLSNWTVQQKIPLKMLPNRSSSCTYDLVICFFSTTSVRSIIYVAGLALCLAAPCSSISGAQPGGAEHWPQRAGGGPLLAPGAADLSA